MIYQEDIADAFYYIYIVLLYILFIPGVIITIPFLNKKLSLLLHAILFILFKDYTYMHVLNFILHLSKKLNIKSKKWF